LELPRLKEARELRGWSQAKLAEESGVSRDSISNYETGHREAWPATAKKLADALGVEIADLRESVRELATSGKVEAPSEAGRNRTDGESGVEEAHIAPIARDALKQYIDFIKRLKEQREAEIEEVKQGATPPLFWDFHLEAADSYLHKIHKAAGISAFVEEVTTGRYMTSWEVQRLCHELSRELSSFQKLTNEARVLQHERQSETYVEGVKGVAAIEAWMREEAPERRGTES
jgi:transcriptional regulator with XRE-family HTH domain